MFLKYPSAFLPCLLCASLLAGPQAPAPDVSPKKPPPKLFDGFGTGRLADFWRPGDYGSGRYEAGAVTIQDRVVRSGKYAACITVREGDIEQQGKRRKSERAELDSGKLSVIGQEVWYGFSFLLPKGFPIVDNRLVMGQWKKSKLPGSPMVAQRFRKGEFFITIRNERGLERFDVGRLEMEVWYDMIYSIRFSTESDGHVRAWMNGKQILDYHGPTALKPGIDRIYNKFGLYRDRWAEPMTVYFDNYTVGTGYNDVDPARFDAHEESSPVGRTPPDTNAP